jgi:hypothetical protein
MLALIVVVLSFGSAWAQRIAAPTGMYNGGNEMVQFARPIRASTVTGTVTDQTGAKIPGARVQVQIQGSDSILVDLTADDQGRFRLPALRTGAYWLGISYRGFNIHVWDLQIVRFGRTKNIRPKLSVGT